MGVSFFRQINDKSRPAGEVVIALAESAMQDEFAGAYCPRVLEMNRSVGHRQDIFVGMKIFFCAS